MASTQTFVKNLLAMAVFASSAAYADEVNVYYYDMADPYIQSVHQAFTEEAENLKVSLKEANADDDSYLQSTQLESAPKDTPLIVNLVDRSYAEELLKADDSKRIVFFNRDPGRKTVASSKNVFTQDSKAGSFRLS